MTLPDELHAELLQAAAETKLAPPVFVAQVVECYLAERRLPDEPRTFTRKRKPREEAEPAYAAAEIPTLDELDCLSDIA
jgi:hypothetical protein